MKDASIRCELVSWSRVYRLAVDLALRLGATGFKPDLIVAIARGGFVPARLLCDFLKVYELTSIRVEHYSQGARRHPTARLKYPLSVDPAGMRVLIVDDVCDSGDTYRVAVDHVLGCEPADVRTVALVHKAGSSYAPDFSGEHLAEWRWLIFPWAVTEDVMGFIEQMPERPQSTAELRGRLFQDHGIRLSAARLEVILRLAGL